MGRQEGGGGGEGGNLNFSSPNLLSELSEQSLDLSVNVITKAEPGVILNETGI